MRDAGGSSLTASNVSLSFYKCVICLILLLYCIRSMLFVPHQDICKLYRIKKCVFFFVPHKEMMLFAPHQEIRYCVHKENVICMSE